MTFLLLHDASRIGQVVIDDEALRASATTLLPETVVEIDGTVMASPQAPGGFELHSPVIAVICEPRESPRSSDAVRRP